MPESMAMELKHLRYFITVAEEGHITRAAERLGIQQPPLSQMIKGIERELDAQLFQRKPRGVELTDAGRAFLENARAVLAQLERTFETTRRTARGQQGSISVAYSSAAASHPLVPLIIHEFREAFRLVSLTLTDGFPDDLIESMRNDHIDAAFIGTTVGNMEGMVVDLLLEEPLVVALPRQHVLARGKHGPDGALVLRALADETFIVYGRRSGELTERSNAVLSACRTAGFSPRVSHVVDNNLSRLNLVAAGIGISVVAASAQRINIEGVVYRHIKSVPQLKVPLNLTSRRGDASAVVRQFRMLARQAAKTFRTEIAKTP
jgi:DNA-binding transcriptional LysR family regulator